jgi:hypothetical protein
MALVLGLCVSTWQAVRARRAEALAQAERSTAEAARTEVARQKSEVDRKSAEQLVMLAEAARSDRLVAEGRLRAGHGPAAFAQLARSVAHDPGSTLAVEKAVAALNTWAAPVPSTILITDGPVICAAFSPDNHWILTGSQDKTARLWDAATGEPVATFEGHGRRVESASFSPDGRQIITVGGSVRVWDAASRKLILDLRAH